MELSESGLRRVAGLARTAGQGNLGPDNSSWLAEPLSYYHLSTAYWLLAPLAVVKLLQRQLTLIDFSLDRRIFTQYTLAKELYDSFTAYFRLARRDPVLKYDPEAPGVEARRESDPAACWKQGIHR